MNLCSWLAPTFRTVVACAGASGAFSTRAGGQVPIATRDSITRILATSDVSLGWAPDHSARLALQQFGVEAGSVATVILQIPVSSSHGWDLLRGALAVAGYERSGFPVGRLQELASAGLGAHADPNVDVLFRADALAALSARPRPELGPYWRTILREPNWVLRQHAVGGLACALGESALRELADVARSDSDSLVRRIATFYVEEISVAGDSARLCQKGMLTRRQASDGELPTDTDLAVKGERLFGIRRRR